MWHFFSQKSSNLPTNAQITFVCIIKGLFLKYFKNNQTNLNQLGLKLTKKIKKSHQCQNSYRKTPFLIPGAKCRTKKSDRDLVLSIN